jgi:multiple sugar transport system ATP-binding protein
MNLIPGKIDKNGFEAPATKVKGLKGSGNVTLGVRPEDISVAKKGGGHVKTTIYSLEPTGDQTLLTVKLGEQLLVARVGRAFRQAIDTPIELAFDPKRIFKFDTATGERVRS